MDADGDGASDVSVVVAVRNSRDIIENCLGSIRANGPKEIIVVDGESTDGTLERVAPLADIVLSDGGQGVGVAAAMGMDRASGRYVALVGPDDILEPTSLKRLVEYMNHRGWAAVCALHRYLAPRTLLEKWIDDYKEIRFRPGESTALGSPLLMEKTLFLKYRPEDVKPAWCTIFYEKVIRDGHRIGFSDVVVAETGTASWPYVFFRWTWYGMNDVDYWRVYSGDWSLRRKLYSISHPLRSDFLKPGFMAVKSGRPGLLLFLAIITVIRYFGWFKSMIMKSPVVKT